MDSALEAPPRLTDADRRDIERMLATLGRIRERHYDEFHHPRSTRSGTRRPLLEPERPGDNAFRAVEYIHEAAREIRRQGLWLWGEVEYPREAADDAPVVDG